MPADREAAKEELRVLLEAEQARADRELRRIKFAWLVSGLSFAAALVPWLFLGGLRAIRLCGTPATPPWCWFRRGWRCWASSRPRLPRCCS